jgi:hypothetical protein
MGKHKNPGQPLKFKNAKEMQKKIEAYFKSCWDFKRDMFGNRIYDKATKPKQPVMIQVRPYTITGLAVALDTFRDVLIDYETKYSEKYDKEFSNTIKRAKEMCHQYAEDSLFIGKNPTGAIFNLKNNYRWEDKTKQEHSVGISLTEALKKADAENDEL